MLNRKEKLILIIGPTAVGKTDISIKIAKEFNGEIISADSMQIYRKMDIGTAKIKKDEMQDINHYLIDIVEPDEEYSVSDFKNDAHKRIKDIVNKGKTPIIAGGTGFYINSLTYDLNFSKSASDDNLRKKYNDLAEENGNEYIMEILKKIDLKSAQRININDRKRIIRAIEVYELTGKKMSDNYKDFRKENEDFDFIIIGLNRDREKLYKRINKRVDIMIENGLIDEVKELIDLGYGKELISMKAIGYKEVVDYFEGISSYDEMVELLKRNSRRFAKRQLTWFRRDNRIKWFNYDDYENEEEANNKIIEYIYSRI